MSDKDLKVELQADASQPIRAAHEVAEALMPVIRNVEELHKRVEAIFTGVAGQAEAMKGTLASFKDLMTVAAKISSGGPDAIVRNAATSGQRAKMRSDEVNSALSLEKETNRQLQDRFRLYQQLRTTDAEASRAAYIERLQSYGLEAEEAKRRAREVDLFERKLMADRAVEQRRLDEQAAKQRAQAITKADRDRLRQAQNEYRELFRGDLPTILAERDPSKRGQMYGQTVQNLRDYADKRGVVVDEKAIQKIYERGVTKDTGEQLKTESRDVKAKADAEYLAMVREAEVANKRFNELRQQRENIMWEQALAADKLFDRQRAEDEAEHAARQKELDRIALLAARLTQTEAEKDNREYDRQRKQQAKPARTMANRVGEVTGAGGAGLFAIQGQLFANYALMGGVLGSVGFITQTVTQFQAAMAELQGISGATNTQLKDLTLTILDVGTKTKFSTEEIAKGATILAQAGYSTQQIQQMIKPIADFAAGAGVQFAEAAGTVTSVMAIYNMSVDQAAEVTNHLAAALNQSKLEANQLTLGIQYAGNIAHNSGVRLEELTAALGAMANAGIKSGSTLGTGMRQILQALENPTKKLRTELAAVGLTMADVDIRSNGLTGVLQNMSDKGFGAAEAMKGLDTRAAAAYVALTNNLDVMKKLEVTTTGTSAATKAAAAQMDTWNAQWQRFKNVVTEVSYQMAGPFLKGGQGVLSMFSGMMETLKVLGPALSVAGFALGSFAAARTLTFIGQLIVGMKTLGPAAIAMALGLEQAAIEANGLWATLAASPLLPLVVIIGTVTAAFAAFNFMQERTQKRIDELHTAAATAGAEADKYRSRMQELDDTIIDLINRHERLSGSTKESGEEAAAAADTAKAKFAAWGLQLDGNLNQVNNLIGALGQLEQQQAKALHGQLQIQLSKSQDELKERDKQLQGSDRNLSWALRGGSVYGDFSSQTNAAMRQAGISPAEVQAAIKNRDTSLLASIQGRAEKVPFLKPLVDAIKAELPNYEAYRANKADVARLGGEVPQAQARASDATTAAIARTRALYSQTQDQRVAALQAKDADGKFTALSNEATLASTGIGDLTKGLTAPEITAVKGTNEYKALEVAAGIGAGGLSPQALSKRAADLKAMAQWAAAHGRKADAKRYSDQATSLKVQAQKAQLLATSNNPSEYYEMVGATEGQGDAQTATQQKHIQNALDASQVKTLGANAKSLETQISDTSARMSVTDLLSPEGQKRISDLLTAWKDAKAKAIRVQADKENLSPKQLAERLADLDVEAKEFIDKTTRGNAEAAAKIMNAMKETALENTQKAAENAAHHIGLTGGSGVGGQLAVADQALKATLDAAIAASDASFKDANGHDAVEARRKIMIDYAQKGVAQANAILKAYTDGVATAGDNRLATANRELSHAQSGVNMLGNFYNSVRIGDTHRAFAAFSLQGKQENVAREGVGKAQNNADAEQLVNNTLRTKLASENDPGAAATLASQLDASNQKLIELNQNLAEAKDHLAEIGGVAQPLTSYSDAIAQAWVVFGRNVGLTKPKMELVADSMVEVFNAANTGIQDNLSKILSGYESVGAGFKALMGGIFQTLLQLVTRMAANMLMMWILQSLIGPMLPTNFKVAMNSAWGAGGNKTPLFNVGTGKAGGGMITGGVPFRDSVMTPTMPGEIVMSKTAVDFVGADNLLALNSAGNRRSQAVSQASAERFKPKDPDMVNVYVVPQQQVPPTSKKDIVLAITDDILKRGMTRQLIKAVAVGAG